MSVELVKALLLIAKFCTACGDCQTCAIREFCGKLPSAW